MWSTLSALLLLPLSCAAQVRLIHYLTLSIFTLYTSQAVPNFVPPSLGPTVTSTNYVGQSNGSLPKSPIVPGVVFDRFIQVAFPHLTPVHS